MIKYTKGHILSQLIQKGRFCNSMKIKTELNKRTVKTRMAIGNAILDELEEKEFNDIRVSDVIKRADVSRMSYYRYYENLYDALCDYLNIIVTGYMIEGGEKSNPSVFMKLEHIEFSLNYFDRYARYFLILNKKGLYSILIDAVNEYMMTNILPQFKLHMYELYAYAGGLLNSFMKWEEDGKKETAHNVALMIYRLFNHEDMI